MPNMLFQFVYINCMVSIIVTANKIYSNNLRDNNGDNRTHTFCTRQILNENEKKHAV